jgi:hypothetical protein
MKQKRNLVIAVILSTAAGVFTLQNVLAPAPDAITPIPVIETNTEIPPDGPCAYTWAYHEAPKLSGSLNTVVQGINPDARANVQFFGEDCVYADGRSTFGVMETDFYIFLTVDDLEDREMLGNWMGQVLPLITQIPREEIQGRFGFVEFWFEHADKKLIGARVPVQEYLDKGQGKTGAELLKIFSNAP